MSQRHTSSPRCTTHKSKNNLINDFLLTSDPENELQGDFVFGNTKKVLKRKRSTLVTVTKGIQINKEGNQGGK